MDANHKDKIVGMFDRYNGRVYWYFSANGSAGQLNRCIVYNVRTQQWGRDDNVVQSAMLYADPGITWGQLWDNLGQSYNNWPQTPYGDIFPPSGTPIPAVFNASNQLCLLTGPPAQSSLLTGDFGDDYAASLMSGCTLRFLLRPTTVTAQGYCKPEEGSNVQTGRTGVYHNGRIDIMQSARWHRLAINFVGPHELAQFGPMLKADGVR
jgi:hypothetical protein